MDHTELKAWRERLGWSRQQAADALEVAVVTYDNYERGHRYSGGDVQEVKIPKSVELACAALLLGVTDYHGEELSFE